MKTAQEWKEELFVELADTDESWVKAIQADARADLLDRLAKAEELLTRSKGINVTNGPVWRNQRDAFLARHNNLDKP